MRYPIAETFVSLQGEGQWTGHSMFFIRFSGCNLNCDFCDTDFTEKKKLSEYDLLQLADDAGVGRIVLTGGEPTLRKLKPLCNLLKKNGYMIHIETNGTNPISGWTDWITVSPKNTDLDPATMQCANEVKFLCGLPKWKTLIEKIRSRYEINCKFLLMPIALGKHDRYWNRTERDLIKENAQNAIQYCLEHPEFTFCPQMHKIFPLT